MAYEAHEENILSYTSNERIFEKKVDIYMTRQYNMSSGDQNYLLNFPTSADLK